MGARQVGGDDGDRLLALGLGLVVRIKEEYDSIEEDEIQEMDRR